ncbi:MAG: Spy/CpxP family protein refolding chaperone [Hyphomicrobiaceae bacterium]
MQMGPGSGGPRGMMGPRMGMMGECPMMGGMMGMRMGQDGAPMHQQGRIAFLKAELGITPAQTKMWDAYAEALKENFESMRGMRQVMMTAMSAKSPAARLDARIKAMDGRVTALKGIKPTLDGLYAALNDDQKKKADQLLTGMGCMM